MRADNCDAQSLIGSEIKSVKWGKDLYPIPDSNSVSFQLMDRTMRHACVNVELSTSEIVQVVAFNEHNGFYHHDVYVSWKDYEDVQTI